MELLIIDMIWFDWDIKYMYIFIMFLYLICS